MTFNLDEYEPLADARVLVLRCNDTENECVLGPDDIMPLDLLLFIFVTSFCVLATIKLCVHMLKSPTLAPPNNLAHAEIGIDEDDRREYVKRMLVMKKVIRKEDTGKKDSANGRLLQLLDRIEDLDKSSRQLTNDLKTGRPTFRRKKTNLVLSDDDLDVPRSCPICLGGYKEGDEICWSHNPECNHTFHSGCIEEWLLRHDACPCCRHNYLTPSDDSEHRDEETGYPHDSGRIQPRRQRNNDPIPLSHCIRVLNLMRQGSRYNHSDIEEVGSRLELPSGATEESPPTGDIREEATIEFTAPISPRRRQLDNEPVTTSVAELFPIANAMRRVHSDDGILYCVAGKIHVSTSRQIPPPAQCSSSEKVGPPPKKFRRG